MRAREPHPEMESASHPWSNTTWGWKRNLENRLQILGATPQRTWRLFTHGGGRRATYGSGKKAGQEYTKYHWEKRLHTGSRDAELLTRHEMVHGVGNVEGHSPDILIN